MTHAISFLPKTDLIITMVDGKIGEIGTFKDLMEHNGAFADFLNNYMSEKVKDNNCEDDSESEHDTKDLKLTQTNKVEKTQTMEDTSAEKKETDDKTVDKIIEEESCEGRQVRFY